MGQPVARLHDVCTGHPDWPSRPNSQGCATVYVNSGKLAKISEYAIQDLMQL